MFKPNTLFFTDGYKIGHKRMLAPGTNKLYGTWIPRSLKHAPKTTKKIVSFGQQLVWRWLHDEFQENFFNQPATVATKFKEDMSKYLGLDYDAGHFEALHRLGYLPIKVKALPEGIETLPNIPHMTFVNTVDGFAWLTLYLETIVSSLAWKPSTSATIAIQYRRKAVEWVNKTDPANAWLIPFLCHDFSARGLDPWNMLSSGLGHATSFRGSDSIIAILGARYFYNEPESEVCINSVNASEHSVTCTGIFYYERLLKSGQLNDKIAEYYSFDVACEGSVDNPDYMAIAEWLNLDRWLDLFPEGILSVVSDTFDLWKLITYILPRLKAKILARNGKLVVRPDSGNPIDIVCGTILFDSKEEYETEKSDGTLSKANSSETGVIELLYDIFGGTTNDQGYKVLDPHIGAIYGDSITLDRQEQIYSRLASKGFASTNIVLGVGSFTYQFNTRDTLGFAAKGAWFETEDFYLATPESLEWSSTKIAYDIYKDPITDDGTKKSLRGLVAVLQDESGEYYVKTQCTEEEENTGALQVIYEDGKFFNQTSLTEIREHIDKLI